MGMAERTTSPEDNTVSVLYHAEAAQVQTVLEISSRKHNKTYRKNHLVL